MGSSLPTETANSQLKASSCYSREGTGQDSIQRPTTKLFSLLLKPPSQRPNNQQEPINHCRYGRLKDQTELPRGVRSAHQQADQHGVLCVIRLSFHGPLLRPG